MAGCKQGHTPCKTVSWGKQWPAHSQTVAVGKQGHTPVRLCLGVSKDILPAKMWLGVDNGIIPV